MFLCEQLDGEVFVGAGCGNAEDRIPAGFELQARAGSAGGQLMVQFLEIAADASQQLLLKTVAVLEEFGRGELNRGAGGKIGVGDDLEFVEGCAF